MDPSGDELAGIVDLFGALDREELLEALVELAFRRGASADEDDLSAAVEDAVGRFHLLPVDGVLVAGPAAFPTLPDGAEDLPHILDVERRDVDRTVAAEAAEERFRRVAARTVEAADDDRLRELLDASYDLEAWGPVDVGDARDAIDRALESGQQDRSG
jgi:hypothetical protein